MFWKKFIIITVLVLLILIPACNLPGGTAVVSGTNLDPTAAMQTQVAGIVASTAAIQTQAAGIVASTAAIQTQAAVIAASTAAAETALANAVASTLAAMPTNTPEFTFTPSATPMPTFTFTLSVPMVSVSVETNCRSGPGTAYGILGVLAVGQTAEVVGRSASSDNWIIKLPSNPAITCWLWGQYATVTGNWQALPVFTPPPTPTLEANFSVAYSTMVTCGGDYAFRFQIANPGSVTWESVRIVITDTVTATVKTHTRDTFRNYNGCAAGTDAQNLEPGETVLVVTADPGQFSYDPTGDAMTAVVALCPQDGLTGTCLSKTISFTP